jgi:hypothetical protein
MGDDAVAELAREEMRRAGIFPFGSPAFTLFVCFLAGMATLAGVAWYLNPGSGTPPLGREEAVRILAVSVPALALSWVPGWMWAGIRLRSRRRRLAASPHRSPGLWDDGAFRGVGVALTAMIFQLILFRLAALGGGPLAPTYMTVTAAGAAIMAACAALCWWLHHRFGASRLVCGQASWQPGEHVVGYLEATPLLARAHEVRLELVEQNQTGIWIEMVQYLYFWRKRDRKAGEFVPAAEFQRLPGLTIVPVSLRVPSDAQPSFEHESGGGLGGYLPSRKKDRKWDVVASADLGGLLPYRVWFTVPIAASPTSLPAA